MLPLECVSCSCTTYRKVLEIRTRIKQRQRPKCNWGAAKLEMGRPCSSHFGTNWRNISKRVVLKTSESASQCKGVHWFHKTAKFLTAFHLAGFPYASAWSVIVKPNYCTKTRSDPRSESVYVGMLEVSSRGSLTTPQRVLGGKKQVLSPSESTHCVDSPGLKTC